MGNFAEREGMIWYDGEWVDWKDAKTHVLTHTLHYGMGVFEGVRAYHTNEGPAIFRLEDHTNRLFNSAKIMKMDIGYSKEELNQAQKDAVIRITSIVLTSDLCVFMVQKGWVFVLII